MRAWLFPLRTRWEGSPIRHRCDMNCGPATPELCLHLLSLRLCSSDTFNPTIN